MQDDSVTINLKTRFRRAISIMNRMKTSFDPFPLQDPRG